MNYLISGGTDMEIVNEICRLVSNHKNIMIYGSEYLSDDVKNFLKYFERDGSIFTLCESSAFDLVYA